MDALFLVLSGIGAALVAVGLAFMAGGAAGLLRFPDFYMRLHAVRAGHAVGVLLVTIGLALASGDAGMALRLVLLGALLAALGPTSAQMAANGAHMGGLAPLAGRYTTPRPGARGGST